MILLEKITDYAKAVREYAANVEVKYLLYRAQIEPEISELDDDEKKNFLEDLGINESGLEKLISASYSSRTDQFLTAGEHEIRAWTIKKEQRHRRQLERSTLTLNVDLSVLRLFLLKT